MKNNHGFSNILIVILVLGVVLAGGYFGYGYLNRVKVGTQKESLKTTNQNTIIDKDDINHIVNSVKLEIENKKPKSFKSIEKDENGYVWWITKDGYSIITNSSPTTYVRLNESSIMEKNSRGPIANDYIELTQIVKDVMLKQGFELNQLNSNKEIETDMDSKDYTFYDYIQAYEKAGIKCVAVADGVKYYSEKEGKNYLEYRFSCTTDEKIKQNYSIQAPFIDLIISDESFNKEGDMDFKRKNTAINLLVINEDRASASVRSRRAGWVAFFYKDGNNWKLINQGQGAPLCSDLEKRGIPKKYQDQCLK